MPPTIRMSSGARAVGVFKCENHITGYSSFSGANSIKGYMYSTMDWMNASREELEQHYSPSRWSHRFGQDNIISDHVNTMTKGSDLAKNTIDCELGFSYGLTEGQKFDLFGAKTLPGEAPVFVYIHGGYWQDLNREMSSFMASSLCRAGAVVVVMGYDLAPKVTMDEIITQVTKGVGFVLAMATRRGSSGVYLCGSSAGAHLATMMLAQNWLQQSMISDGIIKGAVLLSGIYDLRPLVNTYVNDALKMSEEDALRVSPISHQQEITHRSRNRKLIVTFGDHDPPEFHRQSREFNSALLGGGVNSTMMVVQDADHFNLVEKLQEEDYILTKECIKMMGLTIDFIVSSMQTANIS